MGKGSSRTKNQILQNIEDEHEHHPLRWQYHRNKVQLDCAVVAPELDGVLMVIDTTNNSYKLERRIKSQLERSGARILGVILNRVDFADKGGYYGKAYGYGGYGYGEEAKKPANTNKNG